MAARRGVTRRVALDGVRIINRHGSVVAKGAPESVHVRITRQRGSYMGADVAVISMADSGWPHNNKLVVKNGRIAEPHVC